VGGGESGDKNGELFQLATSLFYNKGVVLRLNRSFDAEREKNKRDIRKEKIIKVRVNKSVNVKKKQRNEIERKAGK
jgi:hypothetical protein